MGVVVPRFVVDVVSGPVGAQVALSSVDPCRGTSVRVEFQQIDLSSKVFSTIAVARMVPDNSGAWGGTLTGPVQATVGRPARIAATCENFDQTEYRTGGVSGR